eukprot:scaffold35605_cov31-Tisochrysis_lutea.AAC.1
MVRKAYCGKWRTYLRTGVTSSRDEVSEVLFGLVSCGEFQRRGSGVAVQTCADIPRPECDSIPTWRSRVVAGGEEFRWAGER